MHPAVSGMLAFAIAFGLVLCWIGIGSALATGPAMRPALRVACSIVIGSAVTSLVHSLLAAAGAASASGIIVICSIPVIVAFRRVQIFALLRSLRRSTETTWQRVSGRVALLAVAAILFVQAMAPPRDADVVRYHLAHIRQILADSSWQWVPDVTYAFPFAWTFNYLPFEFLGLPQGAAFLCVLLWAVLLAVLLEAGADQGARGSALVLALLFVAHPYVLKMYSAPFADSYAILLMAVVGAGLVYLDELDTRMLAVLGFTSWIGIGSRYQLAALGISASLVYFAWARACARRLAAFAAGAAAALIAASPFYVMNWRGTGNPFWPLMTGSDSTLYSTAVAANFSRRFTSWNGIEPFGEVVKRFFTETYLFPLPLMVVALTLAGLVLLKGRHRRVAMLNGGFLALWALTSPGLFPTHFLPTAGAAPLLAFPLLAAVRAWASRPVRILAGSAVAVWLSVSAVLMWDQLRYAVTGDSRAFHAYTWYYPVFSWINSSTPPDARFLVVVNSAVSYYLERPYRRADPWLSAQVDWSKMTSGHRLDSAMARAGFDYLLYDDRSWAPFPAGTMMSNAVHAAVAEGLLVPVHSSRETLYTSRIGRRLQMADVYVLRRVSP